MAGASQVVRVVVLGLAILPPRPAAAAWPSDPLVNVPLCAATDNQQAPTIVADGLGGAIVTWRDFRSGTSYDIYAQRISAGGAVQWTADGVAICTDLGLQESATLASDGAGGAIVVWEDHRGAGGGSDIYAQRISADGLVQWTPDGVALCAAGGQRWSPGVAPDGEGGAIVTWSDSRSAGAIADIYAQRISAGGAIQWGADAVPLCTFIYEQFSPTIVTDDSGGAIVAWQDARGGYMAHDIYAQRVSSAGVVQWTVDGVALCTAVAFQGYPGIVSDGLGGAVVTWNDVRSGTPNIYARRISATGTPGWSADGLALCTTPAGVWTSPITFDLSLPRIALDGAGGAIVAWQDLRSGNYAICAQRVSAEGAVEWTTDGVALCTGSGYQVRPGIASDGAGGAIVTWQDERGSNNIFGQRISSNGTVLWAADGVAICAASGGQYSPGVAMDGAGGAIVTWEDYRGGGTADIMAQRIQPNGQLGGYALSVPEAEAVSLALGPAGPNPTRIGALMVQFSLADSAPASLELLDVAGRRVVEIEVSSFGAGRHTIELAEGRRLAPGLYLVRLRQGLDSRQTRVALLQ
jgi:hypothetical protein